mgnify:CR=1 FL=1
MTSAGIKNISINIVLKVHKTNMGDKYKVMPCENQICNEVLRETVWNYRRYHLGLAVCNKHLLEISREVYGYTKSRTNRQQA